MWDVEAATEASAVRLVAPALDPALEPARIPHPRVHAEIGKYRLRLAQSIADREAVCRLRFKVFNIELGKGLESSYETGLDRDQFDLFCEHLVVEDKSDHRVVGTYRMQSGITAGRNLGYYSAQEFDLSPYEPMRSEVLELGRASIDSDHRTPEVLTLLWRGIAQYANDLGLRYLLGCSSLNSVDAREGWQIYRQLDNYRTTEDLTTHPVDGFLCPQDVHPAHADSDELIEPAKVPKLLRTYLAIGARVCSEPAWDSEFGTIDFLTILDLQSVTSAARNRFLAPLAR